ncbi:unnamed protein product [Adineta steineri]|uniref:Carrier domain-containing protein n=1 Tax=Adineta steineri TaxID=433720 RepID=A0A820D9E4_9BILA|nr:unnamed protein product [Adineta steineri]
MKLSNTSVSSRIDATVSSDLNQKETIIERTQEAVARLLGAGSVDRILVDRSLVSQGMDSLAAISLYNWLGQEIGVYIPLADLLQGYSIETIATVIYNKLHDQQQVTTAITKENNVDSGLIDENNIKLSNTSIHTSTENIICLQRPTHNNSSILFYISEQAITNTDESFALFMHKLSKQQSQTVSAAIYAIQIPLTISDTSTFAYAQNMISQMRRIQPRGPYHLVADRNKQDEIIAREMIRQLNNHSMIIDIRLFLLDD